MSGITKFVNKSLALFSIFLLLMQFTLITAAEKSVKVAVVKPANNHLSALAQEKTTGLSEKSLLSNERKAQYKDVSDPGLFMTKTTNFNAVASSSAVSAVIYRDKDLSVQSNYTHLYFYDVSVTMNSDMDADGYYSDFSVNFDADTTYDHLTVYARLYLSLDGGDWQLYFITDDFDLNGSSAYDDYTVRTLLTTGFPPGSYDILIDLYDSYYNTLEATISSYDTYELADYWLEDITFEDSILVNTEFTIFSASIILLDDFDGDGFYQSFSLQFDADINADSAYVYANILVRDETGDWQLDFTTDDFIIEGNSTLDTYILETVWQSGYNTGYYDFRIELFDADTLELVATSSDQDYQLSAVPLEDALADAVTNNNPNTGNQTSQSVESGGSGSFGYLLILLFILYKARGLKTV